MQESPFYERVMQRGIEQGQTDAKREAVFKLLQHQFGDIPQPLATRITEMQRISQLDALFEKVMVAKTLEDVDV